MVMIYASYHSIFSGAVDNFSGRDGSAPVKKIARIRLWAYTLAVDYLNCADIRNNGASWMEHTMHKHNVIMSYGGGTYSSKLILPVSTAILHTASAPPTRIEPNIASANSPPSSIIICMASVHTTALIPPFTTTQH